MSDSYKSGFERGYLQAYKDFEAKEEKHRKEFEKKAKDKAEMHGLKIGVLGFFFVGFVVWVLWQSVAFLYESTEQHFEFKLEQERKAQE